MIRPCALFAAALLLGLGAPVFGEHKPAVKVTEPPPTPKPTQETKEEPPAPVVPKVPTLGDSEVKNAERIDAVSIPTAGELLAAVDKLGEPDWTSTFRGPIPTNYSSRAQMALNLGGLIADGFIAVEAKDKQQVKNVGKDIMALAKPLGVQQDVINRGKSLTDFAENKQWETLQEELESTQNEVKTALLANQDEELIILVTLGGWIRGVEAMSDYIGQHYTAEAAALLRQPAVARYLRERVARLPDKVTDDPAVKKARAGLSQIEKTVNFAPGTPPPVEEVKELASFASKLLREISAKTKK